MLNIQIVLFDGFDLMDVIAPYEVFTAAALLSDSAMEISLVSAEGARLVPSGMSGPGLSATGRFDPAGEGIAVIPGAGGKVDPADTGPDTVIAQLLRARESALMPFVRQAMDNERLTVATVCGGSMLLAMDGLLHDRYAVTHVLGLEALGALGAKTVPARVVVDGRLITGGGVTSGLDVALYVVERELGPQIAHEVEQLFEYERRGTVWRAEGLVPAGRPAAPAASSAEPERGPQHDRQRGPEPAAALGPSSFDGTWAVTIATPVGKQQVVFQIVAKDGAVTGTARQGDETVELMHPVFEGNRLTWSQRVTRPLPLNLKFEVTVNGNSMSGVAKAGLLPSSKVEGTRISISA